MRLQVLVANTDDFGYGQLATGDHQRLAQELLFVLKDLPYNFTDVRLAYEVDRGFPYRQSYSFTHSALIHLHLHLESMRNGKHKLRLRNPLRTETEGAVTNVEMIGV